MDNNQVDHAVHLSGWGTVPALPAIVDSGEGKAALCARRADRLLPTYCKAQPLCGFEDGDLAFDPLEIGQGWRIMNIVVSVHRARILLCRRGLRLRVIRHVDLRVRGKGKFQLALQGHLLDCSAPFQSDLLCLVSLTHFRRVAVFITFLLLGLFEGKISSPMLLHLLVSIEIPPPLPHCFHEIFTVIPQ